MSYFLLAVEDLGEKLLYLLVACNVMLNYKVVFKSMEKGEGGKIIRSNEHWKSTNKAVCLTNERSEVLLLFLVVSPCQEFLACSKTLVFSMLETKIMNPDSM